MKIKKENKKSTGEWEAFISSEKTGNIHSEAFKNALKLFRHASKTVPAYKDFLKINSINPEKVKSAADFSKIPPTDKKNYVQKYSLYDRSWGGNFEEAKIIAASSGTTGNPNFWPRGAQQEEEADIIHELIYRKYFNIHKHRTLIIIGFPMGVYVSGMATSLPTWRVVQKYSATMMTPGNSKPEILNAVKKLSAFYEQTIIIGHPFFLKDIIETGSEEGVNWKKINAGFMCCSEGFSEAWRTHVSKLIGANNRIYNTYGSSEFLLMAFETRESIEIKKIFEHSPEKLAIFQGQPLPPQVFQYNPLWRYIENHGHEFLFTATSGTPLIRFNLHDSGFLFNLDDTDKLLGSKKPEWKLPFLALWGRSDQTMIFYAANIYPQHIHQAFHHEKFLPHLTGKFSMEKRYKHNMDEELVIHVELKNGVKNNKKFKKILTQHLVETLKKVNMEYLFLTKHLSKDLTPVIRLWEYKHPKYFSAGNKPKYIFSTHENKK